MRDADRSPIRIVVMGVAGSGKSSVGNRLAHRLGVSFVDGDDLHPPSNIDKMAAGSPLDDRDRWPWLERVRDVLLAGDVVVACSALRRTHRDLLRTAGDVRFVFLDLDQRAARRRARRRRRHFMPASMVPSQFAALERPGPDEPDVVGVDVEQPHAVVLAEALAAVRA